MLEPKDITRHPKAHIVILFRSDPNRPGQIVTASAHRNQVSDFLSEGWMIAPCYALDIPTPEYTEELLRKHDRGEITLEEPSHARELATKDPAKRDHLYAQLATKAAQESPDREKVEKYQEERRRGKGN